MPPLLLLIAAIASLARADSAEDRRRAMVYRANGAIQGHCTIAASIAQPLPTACSGVELVLDSADGEELARTRTDGQGNFKFRATNGRRYVIKAASGAYELRQPPRGFIGGDLLSIQLEPK
jgi:hypothetical protein